jgi:Amt family ammonium transporter
MHSRRRSLWSSPWWLSCAGWVLGNMIPFWYVLKLTGLLRATADEEALGLDSSHHGGSAYTGTVDEDKSHGATNGAAVSKV